MNCKQCHSKLIFHLEDSLPEDESREVARHLEACASCRQFAGYLSKTLSVIDTEKQLSDDPFFYTRLKARMERHPDVSSEESSVAGLAGKILTGVFSPGENQNKEKESHPAWIRLLRPVLLTAALAGVIWTGILIGSSERFHPAEELSVSSVVPWMNEFEAEPFENFLNN